MRRNCCDRSLREVLARRACACNDCSGQAAIVHQSRPHRSIELEGNMSTLKPKIVLSRLDGTDWTHKGLRPFLEYRDLGLAEATDGRIGGALAPAPKQVGPGRRAPRHTHNTSAHPSFAVRAP